MRLPTPIRFGFALVIIVAAAMATFAQKPTTMASKAGIRAATTYLDSRLEWWLHWPNAARDHDTSCVSCHTALPYALARPVLRTALDEREPGAPERMLLANVV